MRPILFVSVLLLAGFQGGGLDKKVVGDWKYDLSTFKMEIDPKARADAEKQGGKEAVRKQLDGLMTQMKSMLGAMKFAFGADHRLTVSSPQMQKKVTGKWSMKGSSILVKMDQQGPPPPELTLAKDGKRIKTVYRQPGFGVGRAEMVRAGK